MHLHSLRSREYGLSRVLHTTLVLPLIVGILLSVLSVIVIVVVSRLLGSLRTILVKIVLPVVSVVSVVVVLRSTATHVFGSLLEWTTKTLLVMSRKLL